MTKACMGGNTTLHIVYLPCLASCRRCTTCEQRRSPAPDSLLTFVCPLCRPGEDPKPTNQTKKQKKHHRNQPPTHPGVAGQYGFCCTTLYMSRGWPLSLLTPSLSPSCLCGDGTRPSGVILLGLPVPGGVNISSIPGVQMLLCQFSAVLPGPSSK